MKGNLEVYVGIYMIVGILIGGSSFMAAMFYWQMMRMRYMISPNIQKAFSKINYDI